VPWAPAKNESGSGFVALVALGLVLKSSKFADIVKRSEATLLIEATTKHIDAHFFSQHP